MWFVEGFDPLVNMMEEGSMMVHGRTLTSWVGDKTADDN